MSIQKVNFSAWPFVQETRLPDTERSPLAGKFKAMSGDFYGLKAFKNNG
jgi:hypothetical protein